MVGNSTIWKYFLTDDNNNFYVLQNGIVIKKISPTPLSKSPIGWNKFEIDFSTNEKYWNLARSFTLSLTFIEDGEKILRYLMNTGKGFEEPLNLIIMRWDRETGNYVAEYKGKIDMSQYSDDPLNGVTVNTIEGGIASYISANDGTDYDILCDGTNNDCVQVLFSGIELFDTENFNQINNGRNIISDPFNSGDNHNGAVGTPSNHIIPFVYTDSEGDAVGLIQGNPLYDVFGNTNNLKTNANYILQTTNSPVVIHLEGSIGIKINSTIYESQLLQTSVIDSSYNIFYAIVDNANNTVTFEQIAEYDFRNKTIDSYNIYVFNIDQIISLNQNNSLYIFGQIGKYPNQNVFYFSDQYVLKIQTVTKREDSISYALRPLDLFKALINKISNGQYTADSKFFNTFHLNEVLTTCGDAIRNTAKGDANNAIQNYFITTSFEDLFTSYNSIYNLGLKIVDNVLWIEPKADLYGDDDVIMDLGEVRDVKISVAKDYLVNNVKCGYPNQDYDAVSGKYEFNTETSYSLPVQSVQKDYDITSKYRADSYGIEFIRSNYTGKDTTDNTGDKTPFLIDTTSGAASNTIKANCDFIFTTINFFDSVYLENFEEGDSLTITSPENNNINAQIISIYILDPNADNNPNGYAFTINVNTAFIQESNVDAQIQITGQRIILNRPSFLTVGGVPTQSVYNTMISPKFQLLAHGNCLRSLLYQQPQSQITFTTTYKNSSLSLSEFGTGVPPIIEAGPVTVSALDAPLFLPYQIDFTSKVPYRFSQILSQLGKGYIKLTYNGNTIYCLPIGKLKATPATNDAQQWSLLVAPKTDLNTLFQLSRNGQYFFNMDDSVLMSDLNPLHFVQYDYQLNKKYHETGFRNQWVNERLTQWELAANYTQPFQKGDAIALQFMTNGNTNVEVKIFGCDKEYSQQMTDAIDSAVQAPNKLIQTTFDTSELDEGNYLAIVYSDGVPVSISEPFSIEEDCPETLLFEYKNSYNLLDGYFNGWNPAIRISAFWDVRLPSGIATSTKKLWLGPVYGIPDWMALKMNRILLLDNVLIDGEKWTRASDSKITSHVKQGDPFPYYDVDMSPSSNDYGLETLLSKQSTMIYYGTLTTNADPTIANDFFLGNPEGDVICDFGILNQPCFPWVFIPKEYGLKNNWQDLNNSLMTGTIDNEGDLFKTKEFTINGIDGYLYKSEWITAFNNSPTTKIKFF